MSESQHEEKQESEAEHQEEVQRAEEEQASPEVEGQQQQPKDEQEEEAQQQQREQEQREQGEVEEEPAAEAEDPQEEDAAESEKEREQEEQFQEREEEQKEQQVKSMQEAEAEQIQPKQSETPVQEERQRDVLNESQVIQEKPAKKPVKAKKVQKKHNRQNLSFDQLLRQLLTQSRLVRVVFTHFCKENNLTSMKSSLFDDKQKKLQEMSLNKWMVFCKEFEIYAKLCKIRNSAREARYIAEELPLETSQVRQFHRVKQAKQVEKRLIGIFKNSNKNASKIKFQSFVTAVSNIFYEFRQFYSQEERGITQFLSEVMHCSDERTCFKKLSHLKFTTATPQIEYNKITFPEGEVRTKVKSRVALAKTKQNCESTLHSAGKQKGLTRNYTKLNLNPVLVEAKRSLNQVNSYSKRGLRHQLTLVKLTTKQSKPEQTEKQMELIDYFQATKDPILDSYFMLESGKQMSEIQP